MRERRIGKNEQAVSPVIGGVSLVGMTVIMVTVVAASVFGFALPADTPWARIVVAEAVGGMDVTLNENIIVLKHKGGDALDENKTKIIIRGRGYAYTGAYEEGPIPQPVEEILVVYPDLKGTHYDDNDPDTQEDIVIGNTWSTGEIVTLRGRDGQDPSNSCEQKYWLEEGSTVTATLIDIPTNEIIAVSQITVKKG